MASSEAPEQRPEFLPLRTLASILTAGLAAVVAFLVAALVVQELGLDGTQAIRRLDKVADITMFGVAVLFVVWFDRARIDAERRGWPQRRARGWAFWGWVVPVFNLWIPFQVMSDVWRAGQPRGHRRNTDWLLGLWWSCWLLGGTWQAHSWPQLAAHNWGVGLGLLAVAGAALIAIIRIVSTGPVSSPCPCPALTPVGVS